MLRPCRPGDPANLEIPATPWAQVEFIYGPLPPLVAHLAALTFIYRAWNEAPNKLQIASKVLVLMMLGFSSVMFGLVAAVLAWSEPPPSLTPLIILGAVAAVQVLVTDAIIVGGIPQVAADEEQFGKVLVTAVVPEVATIMAVVYFILTSFPMQ
jgi:F0F1-type ATP synthase membrane subunit c/vacuolar-type H+-ATPase subunit K